MRRSNAHRLARALGVALSLTWAAAAWAVEPAAPAGAEAPAEDHLDILLEPVAPGEEPVEAAPPVGIPRVPEADLPAARGLVNPVVSDPAAVSRGRLLFAAHCRVCHGPPDIGPDEDIGLSPPPRDFSSEAFQNARSDGEIFYVIKHGVAGTAMLPWDGRLGDREIWYLVTYIRAAASPAP